MNVIQPQKDVELNILFSQDRKLCLELKDHEATPTEWRNYPVDVMDVLRAAGV